MICWILNSIVKFLQFREGTALSAEPLLTIRGPLLQTQLFETLLLNIFEPPVVDCH